MCSAGNHSGSKLANGWGETRYRMHGLQQQQDGEVNRNEDEQAGNERPYNEFNELFYRQPFLVWRD
jgi:hypothetical protein